MRRLIQFSCEGDRLIGTVDEALGTTGVLIVSGGNEVRSGAHRGMALLAQRLAAGDVPVLRFDRRGIGDSQGSNGGYAASAPDIAAALAAFRREQPHVTRVIGFGNCDAATALALLSDGFDALVLANPWLGDEDAPPPPAALRNHYMRQVFRASAWRGAAKAGVSSTIKTMAGAFARPTEQPLTAQIAAALARRPTTVILATGDRTAQVFAAAVSMPEAVRVIRIDTASHSFAGHVDALERALIDAAR
ncbi:hydrolase 1, exosortase A system-associated [Sphingomonas sp.]|uniref:hydrolase 1, exosortase A system-associated n=1 Tax=Sphingomonas sp. TaxID=28214 RepID=UPI002ED9ACCF